MGKIGIMGGTFNPIHNAHLILAEKAYEQFKLDKILIMPSRKPPHKLHDNIINDEHRVQMIRLAIENNPHFELSTIELEREGITYTFETLEELNMNCPEDEYYFILGADSLLHLEKWKNPDRIFQLAHVIAAGRYHLPQDEIKMHIEHLTSHYNANIHLLQVPNMDISSKDLRQNILEGKSIRYYVPESVYQYILDHHLYN